jgi:DNA-binding response OmpR family regulator
MAKDGTALVFEDNPLVAMDAEETLRAKGFARIHTASSEASAVDFARYEPLDFALIAAMTHDGDGREVADLLSARQVPFAFSCDFTDGSDLPARWRHAPYLVRPFSEQELHDLLDRLGLLPA